MSELGTVLVSLRKRAGLSQSELARRTKLSGGYISQLETGVRGERVPLATLGRIAKALGVDRKVLLDAADIVLNNNHHSVERLPIEEFIETEPTLNASEKAFLLQLIGYFRATSNRALPPELLTG
jgi:transcriptional regulator with XRE-family HTH domain